jgi:hypothetical protein
MRSLVKEAVLYNTCSLLHIKLLVSGALYSSGVQVVLTGIDKDDKQHVFPVYNWML